MKTRALVALSAVAVAGLGAGAANAAVKKPTVKPVCMLIKDSAGDAKGANGGDQSLDVLSADLSADAKNITAVIRLAGSPTGTDTNAPVGRNWYLQFDAPGAANPLYLSASSDVKGTLTYSYGDVEPSANGTIATAKGTAIGSVVGKDLHITLPTSGFGALATIKPGTKLGGLTAVTYWYLGVPLVIGALEPGDDASGKSYVVGTPSCVKPGS